MENNGFGTIGIELHNLSNVELIEYKGKKMVAIPVDENGIYVSDKGGIYLSFMMSQRKEEKWGKTHDLRRKLTPAEYRSSTKEQRGNMPISGYFQPYRPKEGNGNGYQQNNNYQYRQPTNAERERAFEGSGVQDLPF